MAKVLTSPVTNAYYEEPEGVYRIYAEEELRLLPSGATRVQVQNLPSSAYVQLVNRTPHLESVVIVCPEESSSQEIGKHLRQLQSLKRLVFWEAHFLENSALQALAGHPALVELGVSAFTQSLQLLTDEAFRSVPTMPKLRSL